GREMVEPFRLVPLASERDADQAVRLVEVGVERERALELGRRRRLIATVRDRLPELQVGPGVVRTPAELALQRLASLGRLLERQIDAAEGPIDAATEPAQFPAALECA